LRRLVAAFVARHDRACQGAGAADYSGLTETKPQHRTTGFKPRRMFLVRNVGLLTGENPDRQKVPDGL
jgi:hypothetical protein